MKTLNITNRGIVERGCMIGRRHVQTSIAQNEQNLVKMLINGSKYIDADTQVIRLTTGINGEVIFAVDYYKENEA